jgi:tetratricopeptide (TPR) repeat protein
MDPVKERALALVDEAVAALAPVAEHAAWARLLKLVRAAMAAPAPDPSAILRMAGALEEVGRYEVAAEFFREAVRYDPGSALVWTHFGEIERRLEAWEDALRAYDEALRAEPDYVWAHAGRGEALRMLGRTDEAISAFERALGLDGGNVVALQGLAAALSEIGRYGDALPLWESALKARPDSGFASDGLGRCREALGP